MLCKVRSEWQTWILNILRFVMVGGLCPWFTLRFWIITWEKTQVGGRTLHWWCSKLFMQEEHHCWSKSLFWSFKQVWAPAVKHFECKPQSTALLWVLQEGAGGKRNLSAVVAVVGTGEETQHTAFNLGDLNVSRSSILHYYRNPWNEKYVNNWFHHPVERNEIA